jgi:hypothetical protein
MRNLPRFALIPLAALISAVPLVVLPSAAGADAVADCKEAFSSPTAKQLVYSTNPPTRLAYTGQTVSLEAGWDTAAWDSLSSAVACVRLDEDTFDDTLGTSQANPANGGAFGHSFTIPEGTAPASRLCTRIRLAGDPAGEATEAVWVSKMHCFEIDHDLEEETPPEATTPPDDATPPATQPPVTTPTTVPTAAPATTPGTPGDTPAGDIPAPTPVSSGGGDSPVGTPFDSAATPTGGPGAPVPGGPTTAETIPLLPATGYTSLGLLHQGAGLLSTGLLLLVLGGRPRRRPTA